ncbi:MAG: UbiX family flavin prenyltransferase [Proteobacteria bacterium]|nr:UbiX family flavin prenyltransferase [Pseudomonadota bacterium]
MAEIQNMIVAITGASGAIYGIKLLQVLRKCGVQTHLVISKAGRLTIEHETEHSFDEVVQMADHYYHNNDISVCLASGSCKMSGMIIAPCTVKSLAEIACGISSSLISRSADVMLKERRKLVLLVRETPLHLGHIQNMERVTQMGAIVMPTVVTLYIKPASIEEMLEHQVGRVLDLFGIESGLVRHWKGLGDSSKS